MQATCINVLDILEHLHLPEGLRVKDWSESFPEGFIISNMTSNPMWISTQFTETQLIGIERISDGVVSTFEIVGLKDGKQQPKLVRLFEFVHALDQAVANLL